MSSDYRCIIPQNILDNIYTSISLLFSGEFFAGDQCCFEFGEHRIMFGKCLAIFRLCREVSGFPWIILHIKEHELVRDLQELTGLTSHQLVYRFHEVTGRTPMEMILRQRIARAKELLAENSEPIAKISGVCGFNNTNRFYVTFRDQVGMSPREYRSQFAP